MTQMKLCIAIRSVLLTHKKNNYNQKSDTWMTVARHNDSFFRDFNEKNYTENVSERLN